MRESASRAITEVVGVEAGRSQPHVVVLGGGFGGVGAAVNLRDADVDVTLVDRNDYHTFQPLLYQVATDLLETSAVGHPLRDLFRDHPGATVHSGDVTDIDLGAHQVSFAAGAADLRLPGPRAGAQATFFGVEGAAERVPAHPGRRRGAAIAHRGHLGGCRPQPLPRRRGRAQHRHRGRRPHRRGKRGAVAELYHHVFTEDYPTSTRRKRASSCWRRAPTCSACSGRHPGLRPPGADRPGRRGPHRRGGRQGGADPGHVEVGEVIPTRTLIWGAGLMANRWSRRWGSTCSGAIGCPPRPTSAWPATRRSSSWATSAWTTVEGSDHALPQLGSVALSRPGSTPPAACREAGGRPAHRTVPLSRQGDDGDHRP